MYLFSNAKPRYFLKGEKQCIHNCTAQKCLNRSGEVDWPNEGNALARHQLSRNKHKNCTTACPGYVIMAKKTEEAEDSKSASSRSNKRARLSEDEEAGPSTGLSSRRVSESPRPTLRILFIQDPYWRTRRSYVKQREDTVWTDVSISKARWDEIRNEPGSDGFVYEHRDLDIWTEPEMEGRVNVVANEWVS